MTQLQLAPSGTIEHGRRGRFDLVEMDPPWGTDSGGGGRGAQNHYPLITNRRDILNTIVWAKFADGTAVWDIADRAHLWMWATTLSLPDALWLGDALGFQYATFDVWIKTRPGLGQYRRSKHEPLLLFTRGGFARGPEATKRTSVIGGEPIPQRQHSRKPSEAIEHMQALSPYMRRLRMFSREAIEGWSVWGNDTERFDDR